MDAIISRDGPSWLVAAVSERLSGSTLLLLLHSLPRAAPPGQHLPLHLPKSLTSDSFSCPQSLVLPRTMVRYSWWRGPLGVTFMAPNFTHSIFDPLSWTGTQWIGDKVMINMYNIQSALSSTFRGLWGWVSIKKKSKKNSWLPQAIVAASAKLIYGEWGFYQRSWAMYWDG